MQPWTGLTRLRSPLFPHLPLVGFEQHLAPHFRIISYISNQQVLQREGDDLVLKLLAWRQVHNSRFDVRIHALIVRELALARLDAPERAMRQAVKYS